MLTGFFLSRWYRPTKSACTDTTSACRLHLCISARALFRNQFVVLLQKLLDRGRFALQLISDTGTIVHLSHRLDYAGGMNTDCARDVGGEQKPVSDSLDVGIECESHYFSIPVHERTS